MINQLDSNGFAHGTWENYFSNGQLSYRNNHLHGNRHGLAEDYSITSKAIYKGEYKSNKQIGLWYDDRY